MQLKPWGGGGLRLGDLVVGGVDEWTALDPGNRREGGGEVNGARWIKGRTGRC